MVGFVIAPILPAFILAVASPVTREGDVGHIIQGTLFFYFYSALFTLLLGVPTFVVLWKSRLITWWAVLVSGFALGSIVAIALRLPSLDGILHIPMFGLTGAATTFLFWLIWRLGRDDNEQTRPTTSVGARAGGRGRQNV